MLNHSKDFARARDDDVVAVTTVKCTNFLSNHHQIPTLKFLQAAWPSCHPTNSVEAEYKVINSDTFIIQISQNVQSESIKLACNWSRVQVSWTFSRLSLPGTWLQRQYHQHQKDEVYLTKEITTLVW